LEDDMTKSLKVGVLFVGYGNDQAEDAACKHNEGALREALGDEYDEGHVEHVTTRVPPTITLRSEAGLNGRVTSTWSRQ
jgi:hypothetical protein